MKGTKGKRKVEVFCCMVVGQDVFCIHTEILAYEKRVEQRDDRQGTWDIDDPTYYVRDDEGLYFVKRDEQGCWQMVSKCTRRIDNSTLCDVMSHMEAVDQDMDMAYQVKQATEGDFDDDFEDDLLDDDEADKAFFAGSRW